MKLTIAFSTLLTLVFMSMIGYALFTNPQMRIESSITVQTPAPVVCKILRDFESYSLWSDMMHKEQLAGSSTQYQSVYRFNGNQYPALEQIEPANGDQTIVFKQLQHSGSGLIGNFRNHIKIHTLPDGATQIDWRFQYSCLTVGALLLNPIKIEPQLRRALTQHMQALERFLED